MISTTIYVRVIQEYNPDVLGVQVAGFLNDLENDLNVPEIFDISFTVEETLHICYITYRRYNGEIKR